MTSALRSDIMERQSSVTSTEDEGKKLLPLKGEKGNENATKFSTYKQLMMIFMMLSLQFLALCSDTVIYPFFPAVAFDRGITNTQIGVVFSSYDFARFVASPVFGSLVSYIIYCQYSHHF